MNPKTTLLLGGFFALVLATFAALTIVNAPTEADREKTKDKVIPALAEVDADNVSQIQLTRGDEQLDFVRSQTGDRWQMTKPVDVLADSSRVRDIVFDLKNL